MKKLFNWISNALFIVVFVAAVVFTSSIEHDTIEYKQAQTAMNHFNNVSEESPASISFLSNLITSIPNDLIYSALLADFDVIASKPVKKDSAEKKVEFKEIEVDSVAPDRITSEDNLAYIDIPLYGLRCEPIYVNTDILFAKL